MRNYKVEIIKILDWRLECMTMIEDGDSIMFNSEEEERVVLSFLMDMHIGFLLTNHRITIIEPYVYIRKNYIEKFSIKYKISEKQVI